jgi:hypothetical protein
MPETVTDALQRIYTDIQALFSGAREFSVRTLTGAGAISPDDPITHLVTASGGVAADAVTLADGDEGQEVTIIYKTETDAGDTSVLTPANFYDGTTITYDVPGQGSVLRFTNGSWRIIVNDGTVA